MSSAGSMMTIRQLPVPEVREEFAGPAHLVDGDRRFHFPGLFIYRPRKMQQIVRGTRDDLAADRGVEVRIANSFGCASRVGMRQHMIGEAEGKRRLADAFGAFDQDRMMALA
jgi:hypothetical protein